MHDYGFYEIRSRDKYALRCIDGNVAGCSRCVGFCEYDGHPGFLIKEQREKHRCIKKGCFYYIPKKKANKRRGAAKKMNRLIKADVERLLLKYEGMRAIQIEEDCNGNCVVKYVSITNAYEEYDIEQELEAILGCNVTLIKLNYDFHYVEQLLISYQERR